MNNTIDKGIDLPKLQEIERNTEALLGAIMAFKVRPSKESSKTIRDLTKAVDGITVDTRKELVEFDKSLTTDK